MSLAKEIIENCEAVEKDDLGPGKLTIKAQKASRKADLPGAGTVMVSGSLEITSDGTLSNVINTLKDEWKKSRKMSR